MDGMRLGERWTASQSRVPWFRRRRGSLIAVFAAFFTVALVSAYAAEVLTAEVDGTANDVTVTQGASSTFNIKVSASGAVSCAQTPADPSTATVDTSFAISNAGALSSSTPSAALNFWATTPCSGSNGPVTWTGAPTPYSVSASVSAGASSPVGTYTITLSSLGGTTDITNPNATQGKLEDVSATTITVHVVAPTVLDTDGDGVPDSTDNCVFDANTDQADADSDGQGDVCDINDFAPQVKTAAADAGGFEGDTLSTSGAFSDADGDNSLTITRKSGVGAVTPTIPADGTWSWSYTVPDQGSGTVEVEADDGEHATAIDSFDWSAANVAPTITSLGAGSAAGCGGANSLTINFTDPAGTNDTYHASIDWGDTNTSSPTGISSGDSFNHTYAVAGQYTVKVTVSDEDGGTSAEATTTLTVNYNLSSILQPINDTRNGQIASVFKYGSTIPVKVEVTDCDGSHPTNLVLNVTWRQGLNATPAGVDEVVPTSQADLGSTMRFSDPLYVLQLNSKKTTTDSTCGITIWVTIGSTGQNTWANIGFKK
jgi:hypothetical protein